jgi:hypothetical protein
MDNQSKTPYADELVDIFAKKSNNTLTPKQLMDAKELMMTFAGMTHRFDVCKAEMRVYIEKR